MRIMTKEEIKELEKIADPIVKFINNNFDPHTSVIINYTGVRLLSDKCFIPIDKYID